MKMNERDIEIYIGLWMSIKPYVPAKDRMEACEKFLSHISEEVADMSDVADEFVGYDGTVDKVIREVYTSYEEYDYDDEDY